MIQAITLCSTFIKRLFVARISDRIKFRVNHKKSPGESIGWEFIPSQSELIQFIPISVSDLMRIIPNQSEKRFVTHLMKNGKKSIRLNPIQSKPIIRMNLNQSETILARIDPNRILNQNLFESFRGRIVSDWFGFILIIASD